MHMPLTSISNHVKAIQIFNLGHTTGRRPATGAGDVCATFSGVSTHADFLAAQAVAVTPKAAAIGATPGMLGSVFFDLIRGDLPAGSESAAVAGQPTGVETQAATADTCTQGFDWSGLQCTFIGGLQRPFLVIAGSKGFAGCGYMSTAAASESGDAFALFRGVSTHADFLAAKVLDVSGACYIMPSFLLWLTPKQQSTCACLLAAGARTYEAIHQAARAQS
jgi:uncharacterized protein YunC (DUF1805 family)